MADSINFMDLKGASKTAVWPTLPEATILGRQEVHVLSACLSVSANVLAHLRDLLSLNEKKRAEKFKFELHRNRFVAGRGLLRTILGCYLRFSPKELDFVYSPEGKPALEPRFGGGHLHFNLAHAEGL